MHARVFLGTDACNQKDHFDGCTQWTFGQQMRARYGANPGCATYIPDARNPSNHLSFSLSLSLLLMLPVFHFLYLFLSL